MQLHILNGDATLRPFIESKIPGDVVIWREILSEGPVKNVIAKEFFQLRAEYIYQAFKVEQAKYYRQVVDEFRKIITPNPYDEIFLWFEHDLLCQVNMLYILKTLFEKKYSLSYKAPIQKPKIYVIQFYTDGKRRKKFRGFGALTGKQLTERFTHRIEMKKSSLQFAKSCWTAYAGKNPFKTESLLSSIPKEFPFLARALKAHLQRFPSTKNGLNKPEQLLLDALVHQSLTLQHLVQNFLAKDNLYGITDLSVMKMLGELNPLLVKKKISIGLNESGRSVMKGHKDFLSFDPRSRWIGGYHSDNVRNTPRWNSTTNRMEKPGLQ